MVTAIDVHTHINHGSKFDSNTPHQYCDATLEYLTKMNEAAGIGKMFCSTFSSVITNEETVQENEYMFEFAMISDKDKENILKNNAEKLFAKFFK